MLQLVFTTCGAAFVAAIVGDKLLYTTGVLAALSIGVGRARLWRRHAVNRGWNVLRLALAEAAAAS